MLSLLQDMLTLTTRMNALARITLGNVNISATTALQVRVCGLGSLGFKLLEQSAFGRPGPATSTSLNTTCVASVC